MKRVNPLAILILLGIANLASAEKLNVPPKGFVALFNGKDISGWQGLAGKGGNPLSRMKMSPQQLATAQAAADQQAREHWQAKDGVLVFDGKGKSLCTKKKYGNFEMYVDWKIHEKGDSGIYVRGAPQIQIWDPKHAKGVGSGGLYNNKQNPSKPLVVADNPIGEWNTFFIRMVGERVTVKLNGKLVTDNVILENYWDRKQPIFAREQIELQNHGNTLYFRNIYIRELPDVETAATRSDQNFFALYDGSSLSSWNFEKGGWTIDEDGNLARQPGKRGNYIWSKESFDDFTLDLDFKMSKGCNSGVFVRTANPKSPVQTGIEIQILDSHGRSGLGAHACGAIYDLVAPTTDAARAAGKWNHMTVTAKGSKLSVVLNSKLVAQMDLDRWAEAGKNPDGTKNKFKTALKDFKRSGFIGFQDHGKPVWLRNVRVKRLTK